MAAESGSGGTQGVIKANIPGALYRIAEAAHGLAGRVIMAAIAPRKALLAACRAKAVGLRSRYAAFTEISSCDEMKQLTLASSKH